VCLLFLINITFAKVNDSGAEIEWSYKGNLGPARWGQINPEFKLCAEGKNQSPINKKVVNVDDILSINYQTEPLILLNDGETELVIGSTQELINDGHTLQINTADVKENIVYGKNKYHLVQFHFHSPSENLLNGESNPLEIHFVHQGTNGRVIVVGVFVKSGEFNETLQTIIDNVSPVKDTEYTIQKVSVNPANLIPDNKNYFAFKGSLTTPPCTEGLQWIVMETPITATPAQIMQIRKIINGDNARHIQPLRDRVIFYAKEEGKAL